VNNDGPSALITSSAMCPHRLYLWWPILPYRSPQLMEHRWPCHQKSPPPGRAGFL